MRKEKQIQKIESEQLIDELSKMPPMVIATAYLHAIHYTLYGEDVTEKWLTATQQSSVLEKARMKGYYDAMQDAQKIKQNYIPKDVLDKIRAEIEEQKECRCFDDDDMYIYRTGLDDALYIIDKYKAESEDKE